MLNSRERHRRPMTRLWIGGGPWCYNYKSDIYASVQEELHSRRWSSALSAEGQLRLSSRESVGYTWHAQGYAIASLSPARHYPLAVHPLASELAGSQLHRADANLRGPMPRRRKGQGLKLGTEPSSWTRGLKLEARWNSVDTVVVVAQVRVLTRTLATLLATNLQL
ncbi:hypothetical protein C8J57DRAFT_1259556 [Mycena rebaudengoi]|nr:hypothetical protein C8J57DRAFT_1259556 [Mycena rebaudengoi]